MESSFATFIPAIVVTVVLILVIYLIRKIHSLLMQVIGWMVLNGHWFPKIMRKDRDLRILKTQRVNSHIDLLTDRIEKAMTQEEVNAYYNQLIRLDTKE